MYNNNIESGNLISRSLEIMRLLSCGNPMTQLEIAKATGIPRTTVKRILETLERECVLSKCSERKYRPRLVLVPVSDDGEFSLRLASVLQDLAQKSSHTAEWYLPSDEGMVLVNRCVPSNGEAGVHARIGYCREYDNEIDSVNALALAWVCPSEQRSFRGHTGYTEPNVSQMLTPKEARARVEQAKESSVLADNTCNSNNVMRYSAVVFCGSSVRGIISLATLSPAPAEQDPEFMALVQIAAQSLSDTP